MLPYKQRILNEGNFVSDNNTDEFCFDMETQEFIWRKQMAEKLEQNPLIVIISPFYKNEPEYTLMDLENKFHKYSSLIAKNRLFSDSYSINIWGYNVPNMYQKMKHILMNLETNKEDSDDVFTLDSNEKVLANLDKEITEAKITKDKLFSYLLELDSCTNMSIPQHSLYESHIRDINETIEYDFQDSIHKVVPYFTIDEMKALNIDTTTLESFHNNFEYSKALLELKNLALPSISSKDYSDIANEFLKLGWNPSVSINDVSLKQAQKRQAEYLKEHCPRIIDITKLKSNNIVSLAESSQDIRMTYKKNNMYPIYIISNSTKGCITLESNVDIKSKDNITISCFFVDIAIKEDLESNLIKFNKTKYINENFFNIMKKKSMQYIPENLSLDYYSYIDKFRYMTENSSIVSNPKVYKLYEGSPDGYKEKLVESNIYKIFQTMNLNEISYDTMISEALNYQIESYYTNTDNEKANTILESIREYLKPELAIKTLE